jgi:exopolyphosphatase/guanosine-5'-triphosphate,3'-diphosphate pyrophosphatase
VRLTEQYLHSDPPTPEELSQAVSVVRDHLADVDRLVPNAAVAKTLIGTAGTVWTLGAIELGVDATESERIHHFRLSARSIG